MSKRDKFVGSILGLAVGDALGSHFEGQGREFVAERFPDAAALIDQPPQPPWHYTDDTQMAIGVAEALLKDDEILEPSLCEAFVANYAPSRGYGRGARVILQAMEEGQDYQQLANEYFPGGSYGNGAAMRVAPVGLRFYDDLDRVWEQARLSSLPTHVHPLGIEGAQLIAAAVAIGVSSASFDKQHLFDELTRRCQADEYREKLDLAAGASGFHDLLPLGNGIAAQDSAVTAIACAACWPDSFPQVVAHAILLGGDTDTIAAMAGAISGAYLGSDAIPPDWLDALEDGHKGRSYLIDLAERLDVAAHNDE